MAPYSHEPLDHRLVVREFTALTSIGFLLLHVAPSVSCSCVDALRTRSSKLPPSPSVSRFLPVSTTRPSLLPNPLPQHESPRCARRANRRVRTDERRRRKRGLPVSLSGGDCRRRQKRSNGLTRQRRGSLRRKGPRRMRRFSRRRWSREASTPGKK